MEETLAQGFRERQLSASFKNRKLPRFGANQALEIVRRYNPNASYTLLISYLATYVPKPPDCDGEHGGISTRWGFVRVHHS